MERCFVPGDATRRITGWAVPTMKMKLLPLGWIYRNLSSRTQPTEEFSERISDFRSALPSA